MDKKYLLIGALALFAAWYFFREEEEEQTTTKPVAIKAEEKKTELPVVRVEPIVSHYEAKTITVNNR